MHIESKPHIVTRTTDAPGKRSPKLRSLATGYSVFDVVTKK
jgi:hypothetical protein